MSIRRALLTLLSVLVLLLLGLAVANAVEAGRRDRAYTDDRLGDIEKAELVEAIGLRSELGDRVWVGFAGADLPLILFNDRYEFLVGMESPPSPWTAVGGDAFQGRPYYRREAVDPQAFAVPIGARWAGGLGMLERINREYLLGVREQLPPVIAQLYPYPFATLDRPVHVVTLLHEAFHAYQATEAPGRFARAEGVYRLEARYPVGEPAFEDGWNSEGRQLAAALNAASDGLAREHARAFLEARESRRSGAALGSELVGYERDLEWLEGVAKHVEIKFYELAAHRGTGSGSFSYDPRLPFWRQEFARIDGGLGGLDGDYRFYLSGMAQARLLDRLSPGWTANALAEDVSLEELIARAIGGG